MGYLLIAIGYLLLTIGAHILVTVWSSEDAGGT